MDDKMLFGNNCTHDMDCKRTGLNNNVIVCGGTGSGKTKSIAETQLLYTNETSLVVVVSKRALVERYSKMFKRRGYEVLDMDLAHPEESQVGYDPLDFVKNNKDIVNLAKAIAFSSKGDNQRSHDPYWDEASVSLLSAIIALVHQNRNQRPGFSTWDEAQGPSFCDVLKLYRELHLLSDQTGISYTSLDPYFNIEEAAKKGNFATSCYRSFTGLPRKTASCVYGCTNVLVDKVFTEELEQFIQLRRKIDFHKLAKKKTVLFVTVSPVDTGQQTFVNILYNDLFRQLFEYAEKCPNGELPRPVHVICDDFACAGTIPDFEKHISIFRAKRISVSLLIQSESQLAYMYGEGQATTIINNCDTYVYMGGMDLKSCHNVSLRLNVPLDEALYMPIDALVVFQRGKKPVITKRYNIFEDELYQKTEVDYQEAQEEKRKKRNGEREEMKDDWN